MKPRHRFKRAIIESLRPDGSYALLRIIYTGTPPVVHSVVQEVTDHSASNEWGEPSGAEEGGDSAHSLYKRSRVTRAETFLTDQDRDALASIAEEDEEDDEL